MNTARKFRFLVVFYLGALISLLLTVITMPLVIQHGLFVTQAFIIEEEVLESSLIIVLFGISYLCLRGFKGALSAHKFAVDQAVEEKSKLVSRLSEAFSYIGNVNVELQEIQSILCGLERYPQTKREFKQLIQQLAAKAMTVAGTPWAVIRMISRCNGRTVNEYASVRANGVLPAATMGNREILENRHVQGFRKIGSRQKNLDFLTVCLLPTVQLSEEEIILIIAITNQIEMFFILYRGGFLNQQSFTDHTDEPTDLYSEPAQV